MDPGSTFENWGGCAAVHIYRNAALGGVGGEEFILDTFLPQMACYMQQLSCTQIHICAPCLHKPAPVSPSLHLRNIHPQSFTSASMEIQIPDVPKGGKQRKLPHQSAPGNAT